MKTYHVSGKVKKRYLFDGAVAICILCIFLFADKRVYGSQIRKILFYAVLIGYSMMHILKFYTCRMILKDNELEFHNGMLFIRKIQYRDIVKIEYNPEIAIRFYLKNQKNYYRILNVFSREDTQEIFDTIRLKNKKIIINYLTKDSKSF